MPFDNPAGQVLSSVPSSSDRRRSSKLAGCASALFQIFHGKRLFPRKSLPAERPKQVASNHTDDKLPIAKLLLIADENRSGPLKDTYEEIEAQNVVEVRTLEERAPERTPGVVARLMGLETMPYPENSCCERKQSQPQKNMDLQLHRKATQQDKCSSTEVLVQSNSSVRRVRTREFKTDLPAKFAARQRKKVQDDVTNKKAPPKSSSLPPHHLDASFPFVVSSAKGESLNKISSHTGKPARLLETAPKTRDTSTQSNHQFRCQRPESSMSRHNTGALNAVKHYTGHSGREKLYDSKERLTNTQDERQMVQIASRYTSGDLGSRRQISDIQKPQLAGNKRSPYEATLVQKKHGHQGALGDVKANISEKVKPDWRRQQEISRRLSQPTNCRATKSQRTRLARHSSPPMSIQDSSGGASSSQASNCVPSSSVGTLASQVIKSHIGSNHVSVDQVSISSVRGSVGQPEEVDEFKDARQPFLCGNMNIMQNPGPSQMFEPEKSICSESSQDESSSSAIYTESVQRSSLESSLSSEPSLSELTISSEECSNFLVDKNFTGCERGDKIRTDDHEKLHDISRSSGFLSVESSSESLSDSVTVSLGDTASSQGQLDTSAKSFHSAHTYSGRNTAAILQELLTALSSSTSQKKSIENSDKEATESCSLGTDFGQAEKPQVISVRFAQYSEDLGMESTFEDSASSNPLDTSEHSQGNEEFQKDDSSKSKECPCVVEVQLQDERHVETAYTGRFQAQHEPTTGHADFADCEALMSAISRLHHIDPEVIGLKVRAAKHHNEEKVVLDLAPRDNLFVSFLDNEQSQQINLGLSSSTTLTPEDDADSLYRSDLESSFRIGYNEAAVWNKKLVTDCIDEAFKSLSKQLYKFSSSISEHSSATHVLTRVYKQLDEWRAMSKNMNLDDMIEKEMNSTTKNWRLIGIETDEIAEVLESSILSGLLEEMLLELM